MKVRPGFVLPLPGFVLKPFTAAVLAAVHVYLAAGHLWEMIGGDVQWTHIWKGFGALGGAYVFAALASRGRLPARPVRHGGEDPQKDLSRPICQSNESAGAPDDPAHPFVEDADQEPPVRFRPDRSLRELMPLQRVERQLAGGALRIARTPIEGASLA